MQSIRPILFLFVFLMSGAPLLATPLQLAFPSGQVQVTGATPGSRVALLGIARQSDGYLNRSECVGYQLAGVDTNGTVNFPLTNPSYFSLEQESVERSMWIAVDIDSGNTAMASPYGGEISQSTADLYVHLVAGDWQIEIGEQDVAAMVVRRGQGAWVGTFSDGGAQDTGANSDGYVSIDPDTMDPMPIYGPTWITNPSMGGLVTGDLVFFIDTNSLAYRYLDTGAGQK